MTDSFLTISTESVSEIRVSKSKFISHAIPVTLDTVVNDVIKSVRKKFHDASHFPYAYRIGVDKNNFKSSDDGEPSGCAGRPVLDAIDKYSLTDVLVIIVRYFGGVKLGTGGLRKAFFEAADLCLKNSVIFEKFITENITVEFDYRFTNAVMKLIEKEKIEIAADRSADLCRLELAVRLSRMDALKDSLTQLTNGTVKF